jgi:hypothetical protein
MKEKYVPVVCANPNPYKKRDTQSMKHVSIFIAISLVIAGCNSGQPAKSTKSPPMSATEIPCPGVETRGLTVGMQAYVTLNGSLVSADLLKAPDSEEKSGSVIHHIRVELLDGPKCSTASAWWLIGLPDGGKKGWLQVGSNLESNGIKYSASLEPYADDAVQRDVPDARKKEAQVRYIAADIELGGADVLKYYQDQVAAKPDDSETEIMEMALAIIKESGEKPVLANGAAFERKPLRGGTSVVDAGTEFVQPGLDILLIPCDRPDPSPACQEMFK